MVSKVPAFVAILPRMREAGSFQRVVGLRFGFWWEMCLAGRGSEVLGHREGHAKGSSVLGLLVTFCLMRWGLKSPEYSGWYFVVTIIWYSPVFVSKADLAISLRKVKATL